ncbi:MAG: HAMP domain-containing histidine kinase, partial [Nitrospirales bacterium]|nr:HAMP domain-containing histidine kinase [Nitrospirales bacterium]
PGGPGSEKGVEDAVQCLFLDAVAAGTGLGLSITKRIIEEHEGRIEVDSVWEKGTTFRICLPLGAPSTMLSSPENEYWRQKEGV